MLKRGREISDKGRVKIGIIGSQFEADINAASFQIVPDEAEVANGDLFFSFSSPCLDTA